MTCLKFSDSRRGTLFKLLLDAYSENILIVNRFYKSWEFFDGFIYDNLEFMDQAGFISEKNKKRIGFMSWDNRLAPESIEIGHNCIIRKYQGKGFGQKQLLKGMSLIQEQEQEPKKIIVKTGNHSFFIPAQKMYERAGFIKKGIKKLADNVISEVIEYELRFKTSETIK